MNATAIDQFVVPDDLRWDDAWQAWNLAVDQRPAVAFLNFADQQKALVDAFGEERASRLQSIKTSIDPDSLFRAGNGLEVAKRQDDALAA